MPNQYKPEGHIIDTAKNRELCSSISGLETAMSRNITLEGIALLCDSNLDIHINLGECEGIIHKENIMYCHEKEAVKDIAILTRVGKPVCFKVIGFEYKNNKTIAILSRKVAQQECFDNYLIKLRPGEIIPARVTHIEPFGAFVDIGCGIISLLSVDCISVSRISHPRDRMSCGMNIMTVVKSIDNSTGRIYVTHRELLGTWEQNAERFSPGQTVAGIIRSVETYGIFVELTPNLSGLAELRDGKETAINIQPGQRAAVYIKNIIPERMKIKLVLIDVYNQTAAAESPEYFINTEKTSHIDLWRYSPAESIRTIETVFCP